MAAGIARVRELRAAAGRWPTQPFTIGALSGPLRLTNTDKVVGYLRGLPRPRRRPGPGRLQERLGRRALRPDRAFAADVAPLVNQ